MHPPSPPLPVHRTATNVTPQPSRVTSWSMRTDDSSWPTSTSARTLCGEKAPPEQPAGPPSLRQVRGPVVRKEAWAVVAARSSPRGRGGYQARCLRRRPRERAWRGPAASWLPRCAHGGPFGMMILLLIAVDCC